MRRKGRDRALRPLPEPRFAAVRELSHAMRSPGMPEGRPAGTDDAERSLVRRARGGDRQAFAALVRVHRPRIQRVAQRLVGSPEDAEDLAQETFVRAWSGLARLADEARFGSWLLGISVHLARDHQRRSGRRPEDAAARLADAALELTSERPGPHERLGEAELRARVELSIAALPPRLRVPFVLRSLEGLEYDAIAEVTGVRPATVRTRMVQARRELARALRPFLRNGEESDGQS